jgi:hypothetical protein
MPPASSWREDLALVQRLGQLAGARESSGPEVLAVATGEAYTLLAPGILGGSSLRAFKVEGAVARDDGTIVPGTHFVVRSSAPR